MQLLILQWKKVREELKNLPTEFNPNKIHLTNEILDAISHLATKFDGIEYTCKKIYTPKIVYLTLMEDRNCKYIPEAFLSQVCVEKHFKENSKMFFKADEDRLFDVNMFSSCSYLKRFFELLNQFRKEVGSFLVSQDMIDESVDRVLGLDENKQKVNKRQY